MADRGRRLDAGTGDIGLMEAAMGARAGAAGVRPAGELPRPIGPGEIAALTDHPEIAILVEGLQMHAAARAAWPFRLEGTHTIVLGALPAASPAQAVLLRHAVEAACWQALRPARAGAQWSAAVGLLATRAAGLYLATSARSHRRAAERALPQWLVAAWQHLASAGTGAGAAQLLATRPSLLESLAALAGAAAGDLVSVHASPDARRAALDLYERLAPLAAPVEALIATGGDQRIVIDPVSGRNGYGSSARPCPGEITFSSSTATSISPEGYRRAEETRRRLMAGAVAGDVQAGLERELAAIRATLASVTGAARLPGSAIVLTASGTDSEVVAMAIASAGSARPILSIVVSPDETGSGVPLAAAGRHFSTRTALGSQVETGAPIDGFGPHGIRMEGVPVREADGRPRPPADIDAEVEAMVCHAVAGGARVVLHALDASKTGLGAPTVPALARLMGEHGDALIVVVDACQMRLGGEQMHAYLRMGAMLQVTGSKFYGGPPFSGALVLPPGRAAALAGGAVLPAGLGDYSARAEWPGELGPARAQLTGSCNFGLALRWAAALPEMERFSAFPPVASRAMLSRLERDIAAMIAERESLEPVEADPLDRGSAQLLDGWGGIRTIVPFLVRVPRADGTRAPLTPEAARLVHGALARDLTTRLAPDADAAAQRLAARSCLIGQPVRIACAGGGMAGALRLCTSARLVADLCSVPPAEAEDRYREVLADVRTVLDKIELVAGDLERLAG